MCKFFHVSLMPLQIDQKIKPYGSSPNFKRIYNFFDELLTHMPQEAEKIWLIDHYLYARGLVNFDIVNSSSSICREVLTEKARYLHAPEQMSRLNASFVWQNYDNALQFMTNYSRNNAFLFECTIPSQKYFTADMSIITNTTLTKDDLYSGGANFIEAMKAYWQPSQKMLVPETFTQDDVIITGILKVPDQCHQTDLQI